MPGHPALVLGFKETKIFQGKIVYIEHSDKCPSSKQRFKCTEALVQALYTFDINSLSVYVAVGITAIFRDVSFDGIRRELMCQLTGRNYG